MRRDRLAGRRRLRQATLTDNAPIEPEQRVDGAGSSDWFDVDMRLMSGAYVDDEGRQREHAFGFV